MSKVVYTKNAFLLPDRLQLILQPAMLRLQLLRSRLIRYARILQQFLKRQVLQSARL